MIKSYKDKQPQIEATAFVAENATIIGDVTIGAEASVWFNATVRGDVNSVRIGARTNIQDGSVIHVSRNTYSTTLEDEVTVGHNATLHGCYIERGCLIGIGAIILDGVRIGAHSIVAAGSLVTPKTMIAPRSFVVGSPAKVKRQLTDEEVANLERYWRNYVQYTKEYKSGG